MRIPVLDEEGAIAAVTTLASALGINIFDMEIAHSVEGDRGVLVLVIDAASAPAFSAALAERGHRSGVTPIGTVR